METPIIQLDPHQKRRGKLPAAFSPIFVTVMTEYAMFTASDESKRRVTLAPAACLRGSEVKSESHSVFIDTFGNQ
jgi:hypothetical protein